jgi:hypothetical protein
VTDEHPQAEPVTPDAVDTTNPVEGWGVNFQVPEIEVRMVNAAALEEYEIWFGLASIFAAATIGFVVAYIQSIHESEQLNEARPTIAHHSDKTFLLVAIIFFVLLAASVVRTFLLRRTIKKKSTSHKMKVTST